MKLLKDVAKLIGLLTLCLVVAALALVTAVVFIYVFWLPILLILATVTFFGAVAYTSEILPASKR